MEVVATARWVRITARKARLVTGMVQGLPVGDALTVLSFTPRGAAKEVAKVIKSAAANAEHNYSLDQSSLRVARIEVEGAMVIKRYRPKPRGMVGSIFKRTSHIRAFVTDDELPQARRRRPISTRRAGAAVAGSARDATAGVATLEPRPSGTAEAEAPSAEIEAGGETPAGAVAQAGAGEPTEETTPQAHRPRRSTRRTRQAADTQPEETQPESEKAPAEEPG